MGQTPISERMGWDTSGKEQLLLGRDTGEQRGCRAVPANTTSLCWAVLCRFGAVLSGASLHPEQPVALLELCCAQLGTLAQVQTLHKALGHRQVVDAQWEGQALNRVWSDQVSEGLQ